MKQQPLSKRKIHIVNHTHWDREWYFSTSDSLVLIDQVFSDVIDELLKNKNVNFCLDGQISIVKEYLKLHPERYSDMQKLVANKQLFIGPWQTQTDTQLVSFISMVNNLYYGIADSKELFDDYMKIGYLPDTFGFSNQLPMLFSQFDIDNIIFWRGIDYDQQKLNPYFIWQGQDKSQITAVNLYGGYGMAKELVATQKFKEKILEPNISAHEELTSTNDILIPVGNDQNNIVTNLDSKIKQLDDSLEISDYETFVKSIKGQLDQTYSGEFRMGKYSRIHKTAGGIRLSIKQSNYQGEIELTKKLEPLNVMAKLLGLPGVSDNLIKEAWLLLFEGQAHDGIVGCVTDLVTQDILNRNKRAIEIAKSSQNMIKKQLANTLHLQSNEVLVFNTLPHTYVGYKEIEIITHDECITIHGVKSSTIIETTKHFGHEEALVQTPEGNYFEKEQDYYIHKVLIEVELPSFGYKVFTFSKADTGKLQLTNTNIIKNDTYTLIFTNQQLILETKDYCITNFIQLLDMGNAGDTYDFSPLVNDQEIPLQMHSANVRIDGSIQQMEIDCTTSLPHDLADRNTHDTMITCPCTLTILLKNDDMIDCQITFDNQVLSHRMRVAIKGHNKRDKVVAATPGGTITRTIDKTPIPNNWQEHFSEYPIDIETNSGFIGYLGNEEELCIFNKGIKEYQADTDTMYLTLFSTCDELGKPDLLYRPGRASGDTTKKGHIRIPTPLAQELGKQTFNFSISFTNPTDENLYKKLQCYEEPAIYYQAQDINLFYERIDNKIMLLDSIKKELPKEHSLLEVSSNISVQHIYHSVYDQQYRIRFMSFHDMDITEIKSTQPFHVSNLLEQGRESKIQAYRMYVLGGEQNENK